MPLKESRTILMFTGDEGKYDLESDFGGQVGNLVNLADLDLTTRPTGKYRILKKDRVEAFGEAPTTTYLVEKF